METIYSRENEDFSSDGSSALEVESYLVVPCLSYVRREEQRREEKEG